MDAKEVAQGIIKLARREGAEFAEVVVQQNEFSLKRIRQGQVDQPPAGEQWSIDLALAKNNRRKAVQFDNPLFAEEIVKETLGQIELLQPQEIALPTEVFPEAAPLPRAYDAKTAQLDDAKLIEIAREVSSALEKENLELSGKAAQGKGEIAYENTMGTKQHLQFTLASASFFGFDKNDQFNSAFAGSGGVSVDSLDTRRMAEEIIEKCILGRGKQKVDVFQDKEEGEDMKFDVICEPYFFAPIFEWLGFFGFNGLFVEMGESFISRKLGERVMGEHITLADDPTDPRNTGMGMPFDFEGRPRSAITLLDHGIAKSAVYDSSLARKWNRKPTGNALPPSARSEGAAPFNLVAEGGNTTVEEMIANAAKPTLWLTKVHYLGMKHYQTATMTGIAQHGVFLVENGKVAAPVENLRFEERVAEALGRVEAMSPSRLVFQPLGLGMPSGVVVPAIKIKDFRFVGSTKRST